MSKKGKKPTEQITTELAFVQLKVKLSRKKHQEQVLEYLRLNKFYAYSHEQISLLFPRFKSLGKKQQRYQFFVQRLKQAENYSEDKLNTHLIVGIRFHGKLKDRIYFYWNLKYRGYIDVPWKQNRQFNFTKPERSPIRYPKEMPHDERYQWRVFSKKKEKTPDLPADKNYLKWYDRMVETNGPIF